MQIQFENILRNNNRFVDVMANVASLTPISVEDEETIIKINNLRHNSFVDDDDYQGFFNKEPLIYVILPMHEWYANIYNYLKHEKVPYLYQRKFLKRRLKQMATR